MLYIDMKKNVLSIIALVLVLLLGSCGSSKKVAYFQNIDTLSLATSRGLYDAKIMPKDILTITVNTTDPQVSLPFNLVVQTPLTASGQVASGSGSLQQYLVDNDGNIQFPVVGRIHVGGLTKTQCEDLAQRGDLTIYGKRDNVLLIREDAAGEKHQHRINLNDANLINSPYYYLQQNDLVYVEPNGTKAKNSAIGQSTTLWFSFVSILTSVAALVVNIVRN